jgi:O-antigen/teichoic acid export membrane protein
VVGAVFSVVYLMVAAEGLPWPSLRGSVLSDIRLALPYQATLVTQAVVGTVVPIVAAVFLGARGVGFLLWATVLATPLMMVIATLESVIAPSLARMLRDDGTRYDRATQTVLLTFAALSTTAVAAVVALVPGIVRFVFASRWLPAAGAVELALIGVIPLSLVAGCSSVVSSQDRPGSRVRAAIGGGAVALGLMVPLTLAFGVSGAAAATYLIAPLVECAVLARAAGARLHDLSWRVARLGAPLAAISFALSRMPQTPEYLALGLVLAGCGALIALTLAERDLVRTLWRQVASR